MNSSFNERLAFVAGCLECDGCIYLSARGNPELKRGVTFGMGVKVSNTKKDLLIKVKDSIFGYGYLDNGYQPKTINRSIIYEWRSHGKEAAKVLELLLPHLTIKKEQAILAINFQARLGAFSGTLIPANEFNERLDMVSKMHQLNAKEIDKKWLNLESLKEKEI